MLDQAFSARNFRRIYDFENRRGRNVDRRFFPALVEASARISAVTARIREQRRANSGMNKDDMRALLTPLYAELDVVRNERDALVGPIIETAAKEAGRKGFQLSITRKEGPAGMKLYPLEENAASFFVAKQLQYNVARLYGVKPGDRRAIVRQLKDVLSTSFDLFIVRTDISSFYESIDRAILIRELDKDQLLSLASKSHIKCILSKYGAEPGHGLGLPRGVGVSAYLSELYMRSADEHIKQLPGLTFYARYVDDVIAIFSPTVMDDRTLYLSAIEEEFRKRHLTLNHAKTRSGPAPNASVFSFEYLGYDFTVSGGSCELEMSTKKVSRYKSRLDQAFRTYELESPTDQKGASRRLVARIKFMTGNTRLVNSKGFAYTGIYFNNSSLTKLGKLSGIDAYLAHKAASLSSATLQNRIASYSFARGFQQRLFYRYSTRAIAAIVRAWHHEA